jgi:hypothetical protein
MPSQAGAAILMQNAMNCFVRSCCTAALLLAAPSGVCIAQSFESGVKVGANAARLPGLELHEGSGEAEIDAKFRAGLVAGAFVAFNLTERFAVQPEVLFSRKGSRFEGHTEDPRHWGTVARRSRRRPIHSGSHEDQGTETRTRGCA